MKSVLPVLSSAFAYHRTFDTCADPAAKQVCNASCLDGYTECLKECEEGDVVCKSLCAREVTVCQVKVDLKQLELIQKLSDKNQKFKTETNNNSETD